MTLNMEYLNQEKIETTRSYIEQANALFMQIRNAQAKLQNLANELYNNIEDISCDLLSEDADCLGDFAYALDCVNEIACVLEKTNDGGSCENIIYDNIESLKETFECEEESNEIYDFDGIEELTDADII